MLMVMDESISRSLNEHVIEGGAWDSRTLIQYKKKILSSFSLLSHMKSGNSVMISVLFLIRIVITNFEELLS
jgi:hypothetical protein